MSVKVRKVGNSYTVTIPASIVRSLNISDGQEMEVNTMGNSFSYVISKKHVGAVNWADFESDGDIRDGLNPDEYVKSLREDDREEVLF